MSAIVGLGLLCGTALCFAWAFGAYRRPNAGRWTESEAGVTAISVLITAALAFATITLGGVVAEFDKSVAALTAMQKTSLAAMIAVTAIGVPLLMRRARSMPVAQSELPPAPRPRPKPRDGSGPATGARARKRAA